jgi:GT2 family glycosyltransferase
MTTRNRPELLREAIASIRRQTHKRVELVLVDDGSDQPSALRFLNRLQPEFNQRGWKIIRQPNRYLGAARNAAITAASGDFVMFMDDDNIAEPNEIEIFTNVAAKTGADILTCFLSVYRTASRKLDGKRTHTWPFLGAALGPGVLRNVFGDANAFVRRDVFDRIGGFTEDFGLGCEDWEFFARASLCGLKLEVVPEALVRYRQSPTGMLQSTSLRANQARALRPYVALLPPHLRGLVHLGSQQPSTAPVPQPIAATPVAAEPIRLDEVKRAVVFGAGEAGRLAIGLARRAGWSVPWIVDNNRAMWNRTAHDRPVRAPSSLAKGGFDLVVVASLAGKVEMSKQLERLGLTPGEHFVHFLDPIRVGGVTMQLALQ